MCLGRKKWAKKKGKGMVQVAPQRESMGWIFCLEAFLSLLQAGTLGEVSGKDFSRILISSLGALSGSWSPLIGQRQGRASLVIAVDPTWFCCFSGPGAEIQLGPRGFL